LLLWPELRLVADAPAMSPDWLLCQAPRPLFRHRARTWGGRSRRPSCWRRWCTTLAWFPNRPLSPTPRHQTSLCTYSIQGQDLGWTKEEDELLAAVVHEFGENYRLVAEVLSPTAAITGTYRNFKACAERFKKLVVRISKP
jgi:Myb-like DNA-binding domain